MTNRPQVVNPITPGTKFSHRDTISLPIMHLPLFRSHIAIQNKVEKNLLFKTWGGLGDQICAEPTLRFALKNVKDAKISLASECPSLFSHLKFHKVFDIKEVLPHWDNFFCFDTITPPDETNLVWQFFSHMIVNCVDFPSLCALRCQLPIPDREIILAPDIENPLFAGEENVLIHPGRHWETKTFPKDWWDEVIAGLVYAGIKPILIGADTDDNRGTVDVDASNCIDCRNVLSVSESVWLCQRAKVLLTNDSSPLHMAASRNPKDPATGQTWIGYIATCKHPDFITHWRTPPGELKPVWQWREENLGVGGIWETIDICPNKANKVVVDKVDEDTLRTWLPTPASVVKWTKEKLHAN
jgi:hypothetical protein